MVAAVAAASVGVFVAVAAAWAAVAVAGCAAADSSSLQDSFSVITDGFYSRQRSVSDIWVDVIASTALGCVVQPQVFISNSTKLKLLTIYKYSLNFLISLIAVFKKITDIIF